MAIQQALMVLPFVCAALLVSGTTQEKSDQEKRPDQILQGVLERFGLQDKIRISRVPGGHPYGEGIRVVRMEFLKKEGYLVRDLFRLTAEIEKALPDARILSFDLGFTDAVFGGPQSRMTFRPGSMAVATPPKSGWTAKSPKKARLNELKAFMETVDSMYKNRGFLRFKSLRVEASTIRTGFIVPGVNDLSYLLISIRRLARFNLFALDRIARAPGENGIACLGRVLFK